MSKTKTLFSRAYSFCMTNYYKLLGAGYAVATSVPFATAVAFAADDGKSYTSSIDDFITFACDWLIKIGMVIALVGAVMFAMGWQREDAEGKSRGLMTIMAGLMLCAVGYTPSIFFGNEATGIKPHLTPPGSTK